MGKLIRLEWKKNRTGRYLRNALILAVLLTLFLYAMAFLGIANDPETGMPDAAPGMSGISASVKFLANSAYVVFTGVMLASFVVSTYHNGILALMFSYPVSRKKLLCAQMAAVWIFQSAGLAFTKFLAYGCLFLGGRFHSSAFPLDFQMGSLSFYAGLLVSSAITVTVGFLPLSVGIAAKSSKVTVVTSFLLVLLTQGSLGSRSLAGNQGFLLFLAALSVLLAAGHVAVSGKRDVL